MPGTSTKKADNSTALANIRTAAPIAASMTAEQRADALKTWNEYQDFLTLPFVPKEGAARNDDAIFTVVKLGEGELPEIDSPEDTREVWMLLVQFEHNCEIAMRSGETRPFKEGQLALIAVNKSSVANRTAVTLSTIVARNGALPGMRLVQLEPKKKGHSGPCVLAAANQE